MNDEREGRASDAWPHEEPAAGFVDRVMASVAKEKVTLGPARSARSSWRRVALGGAATLAAAAAVLTLLRGAPSSHGETRAEIRREIAIGSRAVAVAEAGAHFTWRGDDVTQDAGDVFYRVEQGGRFVVHTPAGDVDVQGTCFRVRVGTDVGGRTNDTTATVRVYEGKVAVSHAGQPATALTAGEAARVDATGVHATSAAAESNAMSATAASSAETQGSEPLLTANANLAEAIREYSQRLNALTDEKASLQEKLEAAQEQLAAAGNDASAPLKSAYDLSTDDWKALAARGVMRMRYPCLAKDPWTPTTEDLRRMGLARSDGPVLHEAYVRANTRIWAQLRPLCAAALGSEADVVDKIGPDVCLNVLRQQGAPEAARDVAEMRAGLRPLPAAGAPMDPAAQMYLMMTDEQRAFEADLARSFGPDEAHRIMYGDSGACFSDSNAGPPAEVMKP